MQFVQDGSSNNAAPTWNPYDELEATAGGGTTTESNIYDIGPMETPIPDIPELAKYPKDQVVNLMNEINAYIDAGAPWRKISDVKPRLNWYTPTCTAENWQHKDVKLLTNQGIGYIILNRPNEGNTLNDTIMHGLTDAIFAMHARPDIRIVVFMAEGPMFCAGLDPNVLKHRRAGTTPAPDAGDGSAGRNPIPKKEQTPEAKAVLEKYAQEALAAGAFPDGKIDYEQVHESLMWQTMTRLPQVMIAVVNGSVMSTGFCLIACVELTFAVKSSYFCFEDLKTGLIPGILMPHLIQKCGGSFSRYMLLTATNLSAADCKHLKLVQEVVDDVQGAHKWVATICEAVTACGPKSVASCKELVNGVAGNPLTEKLSFYTAMLLLRVTVGEEAAVAMVRLQNRQPKPWEDKPITPLF